MISTLKSLLTPRSSGLPSWSMEIRIRRASPWRLSRPPMVNSFSTPTRIAIAGFVNGIWLRELASCAMLTLPAERVDGVFREHFPRQVLFRWPGGKADMSVATATHIDHSIVPGGDEKAQKLNTRQIDGNANGLFADAKDLLQIDLNRDDRFDPFLETFPLRPLMVVRGQRWFVKADPFGQRLRLESAAATGRVRIACRARSDRDSITELIVTLSGEDGSVYSLTGVNATTELPVGRYAASVLFVAIKAGETGREWEFTFSRDSGVRARIGCR